LILQCFSGRGRDSNSARSSRDLAVMRFLDDADGDALSARKARRRSSKSLSQVLVVRERRVAFCARRWAADWSAEIRRRRASYRDLSGSNRARSSSAARAINLRSLGLSARTNRTYSVPSLSITALSTSQVTDEDRLNIPFPAARYRAPRCRS